MQAFPRDQGSINSYLILRFDQRSERFLSTLPIDHFISNLRENETIAAFQETDWPNNFYKNTHFKGFTLFQGN